MLKTKNSDAFLMSTDCTDSQLVNNQLSTPNYFGEFALLQTNYRPAGNGMARRLEETNV